MFAGESKRAMVAQCIHVVFSVQKLPVLSDGECVARAHLGNAP